MSISHHINQQLRLIEITIDGELSYKVFHEMTGKVLELAKQTGFKTVLIDGSQALSNNIDVETIEQIASESHVLNKYFTQGKIAVVTATDVDFGLSRIWQSIAEEEIEFSSSIFKTEAEAKLWLMGIQVN